MLTRTVLVPMRGSLLLPAKKPEDERWSSVSQAVLARAKKSMKIKQQ